MAMGPFIIAMVLEMLTFPIPSEIVIRFLQDI